jgi:heptosyltransferase-2
VSSSLVIQTSFLGDVILTTPLVATLAERGPVDVITTPAAAPLLANHPAVRTVLAYDKRGADRGAGGMWRLAARLRAARYEAAYLAQGSHRSGALAWMAGIGRRVGFDTSAGRFWYTERVRHRGDRHHAERLWRLATGDDADAPGGLRPRLYPGDADHAAAARFLDAAGGAPVVALAPGSIWGTKRWPHFPALASALASDAHLVVLGSGADVPFAAEITSAAGRARVTDVTGRLSLLGAAALLARCAALVTNDSAPLHLASAMATPTVAVFGPTVPAFGFGPLAPRHRVMEMTGLDCRPCHAHGPATCPLGHFKCMRDVPAAFVAAAVRDMLATG